MLSLFQRDIPLVSMFNSCAHIRVWTFLGAAVVEIPGFTHPVTDHFKHEIVNMLGYEEASGASEKRSSKAKGSKARAGKGVATAASLGPAVKASQGEGTGTAEIEEGMGCFG
jgi:hypothetical protein